MNRMNIIFTTDTIQRGGKERQLFILANQLLKKGYNIYIISLNYYAQNYIKEYFIPEKNIQFINAKKLVARVRNYAKLVSAIKPELVLSWDMQTAFLEISYYIKSMIISLLMVRFSMVFDYGNIRIC